MNAQSGLVARVKGILLSPKTEWPVIAGEETAANALFTGYVLPIAAVAAVFSFLRMSVIGISLPFGGSFRLPLTMGLTQAVVSFVMAMVGVWLVSFIINLLAPTFGGTRDSRRALQTSAYSMTAAFLGSVLALLPLGTLLAFLAGCYGIYILYLGLPVLMKSPPDKAGGYTAVVVVCTIVAALLLGAVMTSLGITGRYGMGMHGFGSAMGATMTEEERQQQAAQAVGSMLGGMLGTDSKGKSDIGAAIKNMADAGRNIEQHEQANGNNGAPNAADTQQAVGAAGGLLNALGHSMGGAQRHDPVDFHLLQAALPASLPGLQRGTPKGESNAAMGLKETSAEVEFSGNGDGRVNVSIKDAAAVAGLAALAALAQHESEQGDNYEKNETLSGQNVHEKWDASSRHGQLSLIVGQRFAIDISGDNVDMDALKRALSQIDLGKLESMKDANPIAAQ